MNVRRLQSCCQIVANVWWQAISHLWNIHCLKFSFSSARKPGLSPNARFANTQCGPFLAFFYFFQRTRIYSYTVNNRLGLFWLPTFNLTLLTIYINTELIIVKANNSHSSFYYTSFVIYNNCKSYWKSIFSWKWDKMGYSRLWREIVARAVKKIV